MSEDAAKLEQLVNTDQIRRLMHRYANLIDQSFPPEDLAALFVEDGSWVGPQGYGDHRGHDQLVDFFKGLTQDMLFAVHAFGNEEITVNGDSATGSWTTIIPYTLRSEYSTEDQWAFLRYDNTFSRLDGQWRIREMRVTRLADGPHRLGWIDSLPKDSS